jgi:signal transduction histidine kinase
MPSPAFRACSIDELVKRVAALEQRIPVHVAPGPPVVLAIDPDQIEQMLINLLRNAAEAVLESKAAAESSNGSGTKPADPEHPVVITWTYDTKEVIITVTDTGPGLMNPSNAFVPFYTTKPQGSGIGLILSRQICEAHGGSLELTNATGHTGCVARALLPATSSKSVETDH